MKSSSSEEDSFSSAAFSFAFAFTADEILEISFFCSFLSDSNPVATTVIDIVSSSESSNAAPQIICASG